MKKIVAILVCALLVALPALSLAENPFGDLFGTPPDESAGDSPSRGNDTSADSITLNVYGETVNLMFDASPQYSSIQNGIVQASYYTYGADSKTLYELYICFPQTAKAGMVITPEYALMTHEDSSVVLIVSQGTTEHYFFSSLLNDSVYPANSSFTITLDSVTEGAGEISYAGTLSANLIALDSTSGEVEETLTIPTVPFNFTLPGDIAVPDNPPATRAPDDMKKV